MSACAVCNADLPANSQRRYCSASCKLAAKNRVRRKSRNPYGRTERQQNLIEDVEWMAETGECLSGAARRLGRNVEGLTNTLRRLGRYDLAATLSSREGNWMVTRTYRETA